MPGLPVILATAVHLAKGPYLTGLAEDHVDVRFELDGSSAATVVAAPEQQGDAGPGRTVTDDAATMHTTHVAGLAPATAYAYDVRVGRETVAHGRFVTAPKPETSASATFLVYGDDRSDETAHAALVRVLESTPSDLLVNTGDIVADGGNAADWQAFFRIEAPLLHDRPLFLCIGNHELYDDQAGSNFARYFGFPDASSSSGAGAPLPYGTTRWGNTRFFFLNGMHDWRTGDERHWLERELAHADDEAGLVWRVVVVHHAPWSSGPHGGNDRLVEARVPDLLAEHKVDLLLAGHDHIYERGDSGRIKYVISGGGGAKLYPVGQPLSQTRKAESSYHFVEVKAGADAVHLVARRVDGTILDRCGFKKGQKWDCDGPASPPPAVGGAGAAQPQPETSSRCGCEVVGDEGRGRSRTTSLITLLAPLALALARRRRG
jgi:predicted MPP superfamily phosphohydrolase